MAGQVRFLGMTKAQMKQFAEENPTRLDDPDRDGYTLLYTVAMVDDRDLVRWLVDDKGASVHHATPEGSPLHAATSLNMLPFLLARGADVTALDRDGWTPLIIHSYFRRSGCVERLLKEPRVIETIDTQATREYDDCSAGSTALHLASMSGYINPEETNQILEMLLCAGADPTTLNDLQKTPLDTLRIYKSDNHTGIALLERTLLEPQRTLLLIKAREINDVNHALAKAIEDAKRKVLTSAPTFLQGRVREQLQQQQQQQQHLLLGPPLPRVELHHGPSSTAHPRPSSSGNEEEEEVQKMRHATLQYVLRAPELGEMGGMSADVFVELMEMITPRWDPIRRRGGGNGDVVGMGGQVQG